MTELIFLVEEDPEGGYCARALDQSIFTHAFLIWWNISASMTSCPISLPMAP